MWAADPEGLPNLSAAQRGKPKGSPWEGKIEEISWVEWRGGVENLRDWAGRWMDGESTEREDWKGGGHLGVR